VTRPQAKTRRPALIHCLVAASLAGCGGGHPPARGFDSREVLPLRDATLNLWTFSEKSGEPLVIYSTVPDGTAENYWSLDLATGNVENLGTDQPASITAAYGPYSCFLQPNPTGSGPQVLQIYDLRTAMQTPIDQVLSYAACPGSDGLLTVFRADPTTGSPTLWQGPFAQLAPVALSMDVESVGQWLFAPGGAPSGVLVAAAPTEQPYAFGLYTLDLGTTTFTEDVPATPASTAWASGATPGGSLQSTRLATGTGQSISAIGDHFVYTRLMTDGTTTMFTGPFSAGPASELALFQADPKSVAGSHIPIYQSSSSSGTVSPPAQPNLAAWAPTSLPGGASSLMVWDDDTQTVVACPSSSGATPTGNISPDASRIVFTDFSGSTAAVTLLSLPAATGAGDACVALAAAGGTSADFSADSQALYWTIANGAVNSDLWASASDGSSPRMIGSGTLSLVHFVSTPGSERLEFYLDSDFVWVDLKDNPIVLHDVVQQVFEGYYDFGNSWLLIGYAFSTQDGSGTLGLVDRDTGDTRPISPAVTSFRAAVAATPADAGAADAGSAPAYDVVYVVRGRNPSSQDGIWLARISNADIQ
jgi:hypothetical protein